VSGCFALEGPHYCPGPPAARYSPAELARQTGAGWFLVSEEREKHSTPSGAMQPFSWIAMRRQR